MLNMNISVRSNLVNGSIGIVKEIVYDDSVNTNALINNLLLIIISMMDLLFHLLLLWSSIVLFWCSIYTEFKRC
jgi:hypothetical protein